VAIIKGQKRKSMNISRRSFVKKSSFTAAALGFLGVGEALASGVYSGDGSEEVVNPEYRMTAMEHVILRPIIAKLILDVDRALPGDPVTLLLAEHENNYYYDDPVDGRSQDTKNTVPLDFENDSIRFYTKLVKLADLNVVREAKTIDDPDDALNYVNWPDNNFKVRGWTRPRLPQNPQGGPHVESTSQIKVQTGIITSNDGINNLVDIAPGNEEEFSMWQKDPNDGSLITIGKIRVKNQGYIVLGGLIELQVKVSFDDVQNNLVDLDWDNLSSRQILGSSGDLVRDFEAEGGG
jgi:hypothetical protein